MALAALGDPRKYYRKVNNLIKVDDLSVELDLRFFEHFLFFTKKYYTKKFVEYFGPALKHGEEPTQEYWDIVAAVQKVVEDVVFQLLKNLQKQTKGKNLVLGGGFFMNSVLNGKIRKNAPYGKVYIGGSPDDSGISIGSALYGAYFDLKQKSKTQPDAHNYFGRKYSNQEVEQELKKRKIRYKKLSHTTKKGAAIIRDGKILAWFQGSSEFGQRALGNRSIVADPTRDDVKDIVNASVKYREGFRPFAPSVLKERQAEFFEDDGQFSYFMEKVFKFKKKWIKVLPGVVHFDGTGRLQTVDNSVNPKYYSLIAEFSKLSNVPIVLNTSFNVNGMPLVETPADAIDCFYASGIDALIMNDYLIEK
jgi:carbamoyltransferase